VGSERPALHLLLLAGGLGRRADAGGLPPKQFRATGRGPLLTVALTSFLEGSAAPATVTTAVPPDRREDAAAALRGLLDPRRVPWLLADAGATRTASAASASEVLAAAPHAPAPRDLVAVHDAARPFATGGLLAALAAAARRHGAAVPGLPVADTIVRTDPQEDATVIYLDRSRLLAVQTPQVFRWDAFLAAHRWAAAAGRDFTDDGRLLAERGIPPVVVPGEAANWKVTDDADWRRAADLLAD
jgi:2-C-methyl-D-erythritol 4-phosphate cytidylyltransferase/2-C-methyl-D-erythritol 2,4-cyclodiphosphate synthase